MSKSKWPHPDNQLDVTLFVGGKGTEPLSREDRDKVIHALIDQFGGVQDPGLGGGVVIIPVPLEGMGDVEVQLWVHDWE